jgi:hypothetical protein
MEEETEDCSKCVRDKKKPCKERLLLTCKEKIIVYQTLPPTGQKIYWFLKDASRKGKRRVLIKDKLFSMAIDCEYRSFYYGCDYNKANGFIETETTKKMGNRKSYPRKMYTFIGVTKDVMERFNFSN